MASTLLEERLASGGVLWKEEGEIAIDAYKFASWGHKEVVFVKIKEDYDSCTLFSRVELSLFLSAESKGNLCRAEGMRRLRKALKQSREGAERELTRDILNHKSRMAPSLVRLHTPQHCSKASMWN